MAFDWTEEEAREIDRLVGQYPKKDFALLPVLHLAQKKFGHLSPDAQLLVADTLSVPPTRVREVVTFYEMFHEHAGAQVHLELCTNISCHLLGADALMDHLKHRLGVEVGHQTEDGVFELVETECLASCGSGPCMKVGNDYYEHLTPEAVDALLPRLREAAKTLNGRNYYEGPGGPHVGPVPGVAPRRPAGAEASGSPSPSLSPPSSPGSDAADSKAVASSVADSQAASKTGE